VVWTSYEGKSEGSVVRDVAALHFLCVNCQSQAETLLSAVIRRFCDVFEDLIVKLAAAVHLKFKLDSVEDLTAKAQPVELLKHLVQQKAGNQATTEVQAAQPPKTTTTDLFARLAAKC